MPSAPDDPRGEKGEPADPEEGLSELAKAYRSVGPFLHLGWTMAGALTIFTLGGYWLDKKWGTTPWLTITGALLGITSGMVELFRTVKRL
ncbi:MAG: AtpZ/AtpI family protein [Deltaproteobacteria bacterium]|nr:AtpZ/AtpI family protein [Deltaproteobacteria bacterium]